MRSRALSLSLAGVIVASVSPATAAPMFMGLGDLPGGSFYSHATAVSGDGSTVVGYSNTGSNPMSLTRYEAFRWTAGSGMVSLGDLPGGPVYSIATAVSSGCAGNSCPWSCS